MDRDTQRGTRRGLTFRRRTSDKKRAAPLDAAFVEPLDPAITKLDLKGRKLTSVPPTLFNCTALNFLFLNFNDITELPAQMSELSALRTLRLFGNQLEALGPPVDALVNLTLLDVGKNRITTVDAVAWGRLTGLRDLNLQVNKLTALPESLGQCTALTALAVPINRLTTLPASLHLLSNLQTLDVSHNRLSSLPLDFGELTALTSLNLVGNDLKQLPPQLGGCVHLTELNVQMNLLCELPPELGQLTALRVLKLMKNQIQEFPREVGNLTGLEELLLSDNQFINLPRTIGQLKRLTSLKASENAFIYLPPELGDLPALRELDLAYNQVEALPRELGRLSSLTTAYLGDNCILKLPREINGLSSLTNLNLFFNKLVDLPPQIGEVVTLATLNCARNRLASLPDSMGGLTRLDTLQLTGNALTQLPDALLQLPRLLHLHLASNALEALPPQLSQLSQLRTLYLSYNPIANALTGLSCVASMLNLTELHIAGLGLPQVPQAVFQLVQLDMLALCCNALTCPLPLEFTALTNLHVLQLAGNQLTALEALPLCQLHGLRELDLCHNQLVLVHDEVCQLTAMQDLDLSANALAHLPQHLAESMPQLTQLKVAYNALRDLPTIPSKHPIWISRHGNPLNDYVKRVEKERRNKGPDPKTIARHLEQRAIKLNKRMRRLTSTGVRPLSIGWSEMTGGRPDQQDTIAVIREFRGDPHCCYFGVFDGHGGQTTSEFTASYLHVILEENLSRMPIIHEAMQATFRMMHEEIEAKGLDDGCAALMVYLTRDRIWLANAGDSRAIMCRKGRAVQISRDHKSDSLDEKKRIQSLHGYITENARVNGVLALSRALGDVDQQPHVTYRPDVLEMDVSDAIEFIILACDGLWDVMSNDEVVEHVKASASPQEAAIRLRDLAYQLGSTDNISVIVASFMPAHAGADRFGLESPVAGRPSSRSGSK